MYRLKGYVRYVLFCSSERKPKMLKMVLNPPYSYNRTEKEIEMTSQQQAKEFGLLLKIITYRTEICVKDILMTLDTNDGSWLHDMMTELQNRNHVFPVGWNHLELMVEKLINGEETQGFVPGIEFQQVDTEHMLYIMNIPGIANKVENTTPGYPPISPWDRVDWNNNMDWMVPCMHDDIDYTLSDSVNWRKMVCNWLFYENLNGRVLTMPRAIRRRDKILEYIDDIHNYIEFLTRINSGPIIYPVPDFLNQFSEQQIREYMEERNTNPPIHRGDFADMIDNCSKYWLNKESIDFYISHTNVNDRVIKGLHTMIGLVKERNRLYDELDGIDAYDHRLHQEFVKNIDDGGDMHGNVMQRISEYV
jgi:hypothetical protein